ncbi:MAG: CBS domain-containing protein [Nitrosopumilaceae archaeon]|nr:CBS domain-containing protein [Nitrosopumilaceae archaeon]NIP09940.1 CBS domain-containing protein [Nitrosopumilaceae archaeon]NIS94711.1 CBS domain-containing protein [Nitrosopumilaceae archaeon]
MEIAKSFMNDPITIESTSNMAQVLKKIIDEKKSRLLVTTNGKITDIISEKDLGLFLLSDTSERKLDQISATEISKKIVSLDENTELSRCAQKMIQNEIGSLVITSNDDVVGIITKSDLTRYFASAHSGAKTVGEYMSPYYAWQYSDSTLSKIVLKMLDEKISRIILRDKNENPEGIVTFRDLFNISLTQGEETDVVDNSDPFISVIFPRKGFISESGFGSTTKAGEIMTKGIHSVKYDEDLAKAAQLLLDKNINGAGVLSSSGTLIGIISKTDIVKALAFLK